MGFKQLSINTELPNYSAVINTQLRPCFANLFINKSYIICQLSTSLTLFASYRQALLYLSVIDKSYFICQLSTGLAVIWCVSTLMYLFSGFFGIPGYIFPLAMAGFMVLFLINPIHIFHHSSRMWLLRILVSRSM